MICSSVHFSPPASLRVYPCLAFFFFFSSPFCRLLPFCRDVPTALGGDFDLCLTSDVEPRDAHSFSHEANPDLGGFHSYRIILSAIASKFSKSPIYLGLVSLPTRVRLPCD